MQNVLVRPGTGCGDAFCLVCRQRKFPVSGSVIGAYESTRLWDHSRATDRDLMGTRYRSPCTGDTRTRTGSGPSEFYTTTQYAAVCNASVEILHSSRPLPNSMLVQPMKVQRSDPDQARYLVQSPDQGPCLSASLHGSSLGPISVVSWFSCTRPTFACPKIRTICRYRSLRGCCLDIVWTRSSVWTLSGH